MLRDDFDYPTPQRETNWTLKEESRRSTRLSSSTRQVNRTDDISGAQSGSTSTFRSTRFQHKPNLFGVNDIAGASPTKQVPQNVNKPNDRNINNRDIEHSYPESKLFSTPRVVNPLEPNYPLPFVRHRLPTPPRQTTQTMQINDIPGTRAKPPLARKDVRNPLDYSDVPLSHAGASSEARLRKTLSQNLNVKDINEGMGRKFPVRDTHPLQPQYQVSLPMADGSKKFVTIGDVAGSHPRGLPPARRDQPMMSLRSDDVPGAQPTNHLPFPKERREWKRTCDVSDIDTKGKRQLY